MKGTTQMAKNKTKFTVPEIVEFLRKEEDNATIEGQLLRTKLIRELYKQLGDPTEKDFSKDMEPAGTYWRKENGYTTGIEIMTASHMSACNKEETNWIFYKKINLWKRKCKSSYKPGLFFFRNR